MYFLFFFFVFVVFFNLVLMCRAFVFLMRSLSYVLNDFIFSVIFMSLIDVFLCLMGSYGFWIWVVFVSFFGVELLVYIIYMVNMLSWN